MKKINIRWSNLMINSLLAIVIGLMFLFIPSQSLNSIVSVLGLLLIVSGVVMVGYSMLYGKGKGSMNLFLLFEGIVNLGLGIVMLVNPSLMINFVMFIIGVWALIIGVYQIYYSVIVRRKERADWLLLLNGALFFGIGVLFIFNHEFVLNTMLRISGIIILIVGSVLLVFSFRIRKIKNSYSTESEINKLEE